VEGRAYVEGRLGPDERIVSQTGPFFVTSHRLLRVHRQERGWRLLEIPYPQLEAIEEVRVVDRKLLFLGTVVGVAGLGASLGWGLITPLLASFLGFGLAFYGIIVGRPAYYQVVGRSTPPGDLPLWRLPYKESRSFIASLVNVTGQDPRR